MKRRDWLLGLGLAGAMFITACNSAPPVPKVASPPGAITITLPQGEPAKPPRPPFGTPGDTVKPRLEYTPLAYHQ